MIALATPLPSRAETAAGTRIINIATLNAAQDGRPTTARSNEVAVTAAERLDVALVGQDGDGGPVSLTLTNSGNGTEAFDLQASVADAAVKIRLIATDRDGDGRFDPAIDTLLSGVTPPLAAGASARLLVVLDADRPLRATLSVTAAAVTASGAPGTVRQEAGDAGGDAVVGPTGARATVTLDVGAPTGTGGGSVELPGATLTKSQRVTAPDGSATAVHDAVVSYTLVASFTAAATSARIDDPVPPGTLYIAGSLHLDGGVLSDATDGDAGSADGRAIAVALGDAAAGTSRTVEFQVRIP